MDAIWVSDCIMDRWEISSAEMNGWRKVMEDEVFVQRVDSSSVAVALMDGHGGQLAVQFCQKELPIALLHWMKMVQEEEEEEEPYNNKTKEKLLNNIIQALDNDFHATQPKDKSGCTIAGLVLSKTEAFVFHMGDSRVVVFDRVTGDIVFATRDHKPTDPEERARISSAGGFVRNGRVNGELALSRAFGDWEFKNNLSLSWNQQKVIAKTDCTTILLKDTYDILVFCDGMIEGLNGYDGMTNESLVNRIVSMRQEEGKSTSEIVHALPELALSKGSQDNMSIVLIHRTVTTTIQPDTPMQYNWFSPSPHSQPTKNGPDIKSWNTALDVFKNRH